MCKQITNVEADGSGEPETVKSETVAEKQTIVYEVEEIEAGGNDGE